MTKSLRIRNLSSIFFLVTIMTIPRSFISIKLVILTIFLVTNVLLLMRDGYKINIKIIVFYTFLSFFGITWAIIGVINNGNIVGINDNIRLWVYWSLAYAIVYIIIRNNDGLMIFHKSIILASFTIFLINIVGFLDMYLKINYIDSAIKEELEMAIGFHEGYTQILSHNIASLLFIVPYLLSVLSRDCQMVKKNLTIYMALVCTLFLVVLSGRRALWMVVFISPILIYVISLITGSTIYIYGFLKKAPFVLFSIGIFAIILIQALPKGSFLDIGSLEHLRGAFSSADERSIQLTYLINKFIQYPFFGTGFGVGAGYIRNTEQPWIYELSYFQALYNLGIIGMTLLISFYSLYVLKIISIIRNGLNKISIPISLLIGLFSFLIGTYSNPYLSSFDFLLYLGILPFLSTYSYSKDYSKLVLSNEKF